MGTIQLDSNIYYFGLGLLLILIITVVILGFVISFFKDQLKEAKEDLDNNDTLITHYKVDNASQKNQLEKLNINLRDSQSYYEVLSINHNKSLAIIDANNSEINVLKDVNEVFAKKILELEQKLNSSIADNRLQQDKPASSPRKRKDKGSGNRIH